MDGFEPAPRLGLEVYEHLLLEPLKSNFYSLRLERTGSQIDLRGNIRHGEACEARMVRHLRATCSVVEPMHRGADAKCTMSDGRIEFHEAKDGGSQLTPYQRQFRLKALESGHRYIIHRCTKEK